MVPATVAGRLRAWRTHRVIRSYVARVVEHNYGGSHFRVYLADPLAQSWYDHDCPEQPEVVMLRQSRLRPGARVFNLGAHQGVVALMLAREVGNSGLVVAVEPNPHNAASARKNCELNHVEQIEVMQAAVAHQVGTLALNEMLNGQLDDGTGLLGRRVVDSLTVDSLADRFGAPDVVYIDVEGAECLALAGASRVLAEGADFVIEVHGGCGLEKLGGSVDRVLSYFPQDRFTLLERADEDATFRPMTKGDPINRGRFFLLALSRTPPAA